MVTLESIKVVDKHRVEYSYKCEGTSQKYFSKKDLFFVEYDYDISAVPQSILAIPFVANFMPIAWFSKFNVSVEQLDETFINSMEELKNEFSIYFPTIAAESKLLVKESVQNFINGKNCALLFSGGLDAFESLTRNISEKPFLISVHGADIELSDTKKWEDFKNYNSQEDIIDQNRMCYVKSNLRTFYTYEVDLLVNIGWWGKIQHGIALLTLIAPLSYIFGITTTLIASSNTGEVSFGWGSTSETDEKVKWANQKVIHDGFEFRRTEKIENIVNFAKLTNHKVKLRVCYSELRTSYNCSRCAKCQRTMFGFLLCGVNPNEYGFNVPIDFYDIVLSNFNINAIMSVGVKYEWKCLQEKAAAITKPFIFQNDKDEMKSFRAFLNLDIDEIVNTNLDKVEDSKKIKFIIINKFPKIFNLYLKIRRKF